MKIAIIGTGNVGQTLASKFFSLGHDVMIGTRDIQESLSRKEPDRYGNPGFGVWIGSNPGIQVGTVADAVAFGEILVNATLGASSIQTFQLADARRLDGKIIIDIANPLDFSKGMPPGLIPELSNFTSLGEEMQKAFPGAKIIKTFNTMWCGLMVNPGMVGDGEHVNFISGNDNEAKQKIRELMHEIGWRDESIIDLGDIAASRGTEAILPLWLRLMMIKQTAAFNFKIVS